MDFLLLLSQHKPGRGSGHALDNGSGCPYSGGPSEANRSLRAGRLGPHASSETEVKVTRPSRGTIILCQL